MKQRKKLLWLVLIIYLAVFIKNTEDFAERGFDRLSSFARQKYLFDKTEYIDASEYSKNYKGFSEGC